MTKAKFFGLCLTAAALTAGAAEVIKLNDPGAWREESKLVALPDGAMRITGKNIITTVDYPHINKAKKYTLRGKVRQGKNSPKTGFSIGFILLNDEERSLPLCSFYAVKGSEAVLTAPLNVGDTTVKVKAENPKIWRPVPGFEVAYQAKKDYSDIPNEKLSGRIKKMATSGSDVTVSLSYASRRAFPAGTPVRLQSGYSYYWALYRTSALKDEWQEFSAEVSGVLPPGEFNDKSFPASPEVEAVKIYISCNGVSATAVTELKDLELVIE